MYPMQERKMNKAAKNYKQAMNDLRAGRISPDEFRAIVRASKAQNGQAAHEAAKVAAIASSVA
jgi:ribosome recycling factor